MKLPWYLRQRPSAALVASLGGLFSVVSGALAQPWAASSPRLWWGGVATSADGKTIVAAATWLDYCSAAPAPVYVSTNAGGSWAQTTAPSNHWSGVACSAGGTKLVAVASFFGDPAAGNYINDGLIYTSPDAGATWMPTRVPRNNWTSVASSADGTRLVAVAGSLWDPASSNYVGGVIYRSSDAGATWTQTTAPNTNWTAVASSADGTKLVAVSAPGWDGDLQSLVGKGGIYSSLDAGATWNRTSAAPSTNWSCVASSADGVHLVAGVDSGLIYTSADSGASWSWTSAPNTNWTGVASSADGTKLVAGSDSFGIYTSSDGGATWAGMSVPGGPTAVACSADGYRLVAGGIEGPIWTWPYSGPWRLANTPANYSNWGPAACSADGTKLVVFGPGSLYSSGDSGTTWTQTNAPTDVGACASSADGAKQVAVSMTGAIYRSSNAGVSWTQTSAPSDNWTSVAASADGTKLVALAAPLWSGSNYLDGGAIYRSSDAGTTWVQASAPSNVWSCVASSADGTKLVAGGEPAVYRSTDAGATWIPTSLPSGYWNSVASSADGAKLVAVAGALWDPGASNYTSGAIYHSSDSSATWVRTAAPTGKWIAVASSADGTILCALHDVLDYNDEPEISTNSGVSWAPANVPAGWWSGVAASADGSNLVVTGYGQIATLHSPATAPPIPTSPQLAIDRAGADLDLSWLVPSSPFVLQQNSDLRSPEWVAVPTPPTLNLTNLHLQLTLPPTPGNVFFRLKQQ